MRIMDLHVITEFTNGLPFKQAHYFGDWRKGYIPKVGETIPGTDQTVMKITREYDEDGAWIFCDCK